QTLKKWMDNAISFHMDRIHTPLLMEEFGDGVHDNTPGEVPISLAVHYELFTGLTRLNRPVELYYYPDDDHMPDHPLARLTTLQRNLDWYRFWLEGYEDPDPIKREQYDRWHILHSLDQADTNGGE